MKFITSNAKPGYWHLAARRELTGSKTGKVFAASWVAACTRRALGGAWGATTTEVEPSEPICPRCAKEIARANGEPK